MACARVVPRTRHGARRAGAGLMLDQDAPVEKLRSGLKSLLEEDSYGRAAAALGERLRAQDAAAAAADRVDAILDPAAVAR